MGGCIPNRQKTNRNFILPRNSIITVKNNFIQLNKDPLSMHYKLIDKLGFGSFGYVLKALHLKTEKLYAIKIVNKVILNIQDDERRFLREIEILYHLDHPNIVKMFEYFIDESNYYIVQEFIEGGDLFTIISQKGAISETTVSYISKQIVSALHHIHSATIVHRDIKPRNIMLVKKQDKQNQLKLKKSQTFNENPEDFQIKIIDFGISNLGKQKYSEKIGTPFYVAPEVLKGDYTYKCDIWSAGVVIYMILNGNPPFDGQNESQIINSILNQKLPESRHGSNSAKNFLTQMLNRNSEERPSAFELLFHKFISSNDNQGNISSNEFTIGLTDLKNFTAKSKLSQACRAFISHKSSQNNSDIYKMFQKLDVSKDHRLSKDELMSGFHSCSFFSNYSELEISNLFEELDRNKNGFVDYEEFLSACISQNDLLTKNNLKMAFDYFDTDGSGKLSVDEVRNALITSNIYEKKLSEIMNKLDENGDGEIEFNEFIKIIE